MGYWLRCGLNVRNFLCIVVHVSCYRTVKLCKQSLWAISRLSESYSSVILSLSPAPYKLEIQLLYVWFLLPDARATLFPIGFLKLVSL